MLSNQKVTAHVVVTNSSGHLVTPVGPFSWSVSDPAIASITPAADTLSAEIVALAVGTVSVTVSGMDAVGTAPLPIDPVPTPVFTLTITFDAPVPQ